MALNMFLTKEQLEKLKDWTAEQLETMYDELLKGSPTKERISELELGITKGEEMVSDVSEAIQNKQYKSRYTVGVAPLAPDTFKVNYYRDGDCIKTRTTTMDGLIASKNNWLAKNDRQGK